MFESDVREPTCFVSLALEEPLEHAKSMWKVYRDQAL